MVMVVSGRRGVRAGRKANSLAYCTPTSKSKHQRIGMSSEQRNKKGGNEIARSRLVQSSAQTPCAATPRQERI